MSRTKRIERKVAYLGNRIEEMTGREKVDFALDSKNPLAVVLLDIRIVADGEEMIIPYPKITDSEEQIMSKAVSIMLVLNRLMEQYENENIFTYVSESEDGGIFEAEQEAKKIIHSAKKGGKNNEK